MMRCALDLYLIKKGTKYLLVCAFFTTLFNGFTQSSSYYTHRLASCEDKQILQVICTTQWINYVVKNKTSMILVFRMQKKEQSSTTTFAL